MPRKRYKPEEIVTKLRQVDERAAQNVDGDMNSAHLLDLVQRISRLLNMTGLAVVGEDIRTIMTKGAASA